jgi:uncharacterized protein YceK
MRYALVAVLAVAFTGCGDASTADDEPDQAEICNRAVQRHDDDTDAEWNCANKTDPEPNPSGY